MRQEGEKRSDLSSSSQSSFLPSSSARRIKHTAPSSVRVSSPFSYDCVKYHLELITDAVYACPSASFYYYYFIIKTIPCTWIFLYIQLRNSVFEDLGIKNYLDKMKICSDVSILLLHGAKCNAAKKKSDTVVSTLILEHSSIHVSDDDGMCKREAMWPPLKKKKL